MKKKILKKFITLLSNNNIDGYVIPKNDNFFTEQVKHDRLKLITKFTGSAGLAVILKKKKYLFVDSRYTIQAKLESGRNYEIVKIHQKLPRDQFQNIILGYDPNVFTFGQLNYLFGNNIKLKSIKKNLVDQIFKVKKIKDKPFYSLPNNVSGESHQSKINKISKYLKKKKADYLFISSPENVAWLLNIRGSDTPYSPLPNSNLLLTKNKKLYLIAKKFKTKKLIIEKKLSLNQIIEIDDFQSFIQNLKGKRFITDNKTLSVFNENTILSKFKIICRNDPCYFFKSIKNSTEIQNMIESHILDGVALTKFIFWIKNLKKNKVTEIDAEKKLESLRKKNKKYLYPSFGTIAGSGPNGAIVHYRATKKTNRKINKKDLFLCDSGGQYKYGTTDVTRTISLSEQSKKIKNIFTLVLKGHIAVATSNLKKNNTGKKIDINARRFLKKQKLDYGHGTGHGVGYFLNVHEGPQSISKFSKVKLKEGMILSNEPGYYKQGQYGIRIENLVYIKKKGGKMFFENLTLAPIDKTLINFSLLNTKEKDYLFNYHLSVYSKISKYLNNNEKKWLVKNL